VTLPPHSLEPNQTKMKQTIIDRKVRIHAPKQKVWDTLADFGNVYKLSPNLQSSHSTSELKSGLGAERHCDFTAMGAEVEERITEWNEGESMKIDIYESKKIPMIAGMGAFFTVKSEGEFTVLSGTFQYHMTNPLGNLLNNLAMKKANIKNWEQFMAGIKHHVETGEDVIEQTSLNTAVVEAF